MSHTQLTKPGLLQRSRHALLAGGMTAFLGMALSASATLIPLPQICLTPDLTTANLGEITSPPNSSPTIISGLDTIELQFYVDPVFLPFAAVVGGTGQAAVILTQTGTPEDIVILTVAQLLGKNSVDIYFAQNGAANFSSLISLWGSAPQVALTGGQQDVSSYLYTSEETLAICVGCGQSTTVPDSGSTLALLALALAGVGLAYRQLPRPSKNLR